MANTLGLMAASWGVLMAVSPILQVRRILERHSSADVSIGYLAVLEIGFLLWIVYGLTLGNPVIWVPNTVACTTGLATIVVALRFRSPRPT